MGFPANVTVGSLLSFLQEELKKGNVDLETKVFVEVYLLSGEEEILKPQEEKLGYHIPDDNMDEVLNFRMGVWQSNREGESRSEHAENTVALSCYLGPDKNGPFFRKAYKEVKHRKRMLK